MNTDARSISRRINERLPIPGTRWKNVKTNEVITILQVSLGHEHGLRAVVAWEDCDNKTHQCFGSNFRGFEPMDYPARVIDLPE